MISMSSEIRLMSASPFDSEVRLSAHPVGDVALNGVCRHDVQSQKLIHFSDKSKGWPCQCSPARRVHAGEQARLAGPGLPAFRCAL